MVTLTTGNDRYNQDESGNPKPDTINALGGDDLILTSTLGGSLVRGGDDDDTLQSKGPSGVNNSGQADTLKGGNGSDSLDFEAAAGFGFGDDGNDTLEAISRTTLYGGSGDDFFRGLLGDNWYSANEGDDTILISERDSIYGGKGSDTISFSTPTRDLPNNLDLVNLSLDELTALNSATGDKNFISANREADLVLGWGHNDTIYGGKDNDTILSFGKQVFLSGDQGDDTVFNMSLPREGGVPANSTAIALTSIEMSTLSGGPGNDLIEGAVGPFGGGRNILDGGEGDDTIRGQAARETLIGGAGDDLITSS